MIGDGLANLLLGGLGAGLSVGSRFLPSLRSQITRSFTLEISAGRDVARRWYLDGQARRVRTDVAADGPPDHSLAFATGGQALRVLLSPRAVQRIVAGLQRREVRIEGSALVLLWFLGLTRRLVRIGRDPGPRGTLPGAYLAPDRSTHGAEMIPIEPAVNELDAGWTAAWNARAKLWLVRAATGEPMPEP